MDCHMDDHGDLFVLFNQLLQQNKDNIGAAQLEFEKELQTRFLQVISSQNN